MKKGLIKKITLITLSCAFIVGTISLIFYGILRPSAAPFKGSNSQYLNDQIEIIDYKTPSNDNSVDLSTLYRLGNTDTGEIVKLAAPSNDTIININTALDLYAFSRLANTYDEFLGYSYQLLSNINYDDCPYSFIPIAWENGKLFNGTFNGNGFEISNLDLVKISEDNKNNYQGIHYFAMFSKLGPTAILTKLGLRDTNIVINAAIEDLAVASMVGYIASGAQASYIFATDLRDPILDEAGITASGGYRISGLVYQNEGTLQNAYTAYNSISNYTVTDYIDFSEILTINTGSISNLFFYNSSIKEYLKPEGGRNKYRIEYKAPISRIFEVDIHYGEYVSSLNQLDSAVVSSDLNKQWYTKNSYVDLAIYLSDIKTPITRGLECSKDAGGFYHFTIENEQDFGYMFELMNHNDKFATDKMIFEIKNDLNLDLINPDNYYYSRSIGATIKGIDMPNGGSATLADGTKTTKPTIYNPNLTNKVITEGINSYGLFPWLTGSVTDLNIIIERERTSTINVLSSDINKNNIKAFGILSGYASGATIANVNVFGNISIDSSIGKYYVGGAIGILSGLSSLENVTTAGEIVCNDAIEANMSSPTGYMEGSSIGGVVAYIDRTYGSINSLMSAMNITVEAESSNDLAVGGVLGAGYIASLNGIENRGSINIGSSNKSSSFRKLYVSGAIARILGVKGQITNINNQGRVEVYLNPNNEAYISGILNADIITASTSYLDASAHKIEGSYYFYASSLKNQANVIIHSSLKDGSGYTQGINLLSKNGFKTKISGVSNLKYTSINGVNNNITEELVIDMTIINKYAPVINVLNDDSHNTVELDTIYNLRDIKLSANGALMNKDYLYSGVVNGKFISYMDISNEGNITIDFTSSASKANLGNLIVNGVFEELSNNHFADNIFNDGDIIIDSKRQNLAFNIYASGIAYKNEAVLSDTSYNPLLPDFDKESKGSFNNVINNGEIKITSTNYDENSYVNDNLSSYVSGDIYASGIVGINNGIISNTFNLGNINILMSLPSTKGMYASGITYLNDGEFAQIKDSANNGTIKAINVGITDPIAYASGIVGKNTTSLNNTSQIIAFTINYGEVYAFSSISNDSTIDTNEKVKSGGFLAEGLCNLINTINYGNVFSTNTAGGMIGAFKLNSQSPVATIANTLNYGIVKAINAYTPEQSGNVYAKISDILNKNEKYIYVGIPARPKYQFTGALIGVADYANQPDKINIRYLVNFFEGVLIVAQEMNQPQSVDINIVKTLYNVSPLNKFLGIEVTYAPLSSVSDEFGNIGVFAPEFGFRQAINGKNLDDNYPTDKYIGDFFSFVGFEKINEVIFNNIGWGQIAYMDAAERFARDLTSIVNLLNLDQVKQNNLLDEAINDSKWINRCDNQILNNLLTEIMNGNLDEASLKELVSFVLFDNNGHNIVSKELRKKIVNQVYIYLSENGKDAYTILNSLLYDEVLAKIVAEPNLEYKEISDEIRRIISKADNLDSIMDSYIEALKNYIEAPVKPDKSLVDPLFDVNYESYYYKSKLDLLDVILSGYTDEQLANILSLISNENTDNRTKYLLYLNNNPDEIRNIYTHLIASNDYSNAEYLRVMNEAFKRYGISSIINDGTAQIDGEMMQRVNSVFDNISKTTVSSITSFNKTSVGDYVALWNLIKGNGAFKTYLKSILPQVTSAGNDPNGREKKTGPGIYAKATEFNNTYQSNDSPSEVTNYFSGTNVVGKVRKNTDEGAIDTRYIYTPDEAVSERTYFYGPYMDATIILDNHNNPIANEKIFYPGNSNENYNLEYDLYTIGTASTGSSNVRYIPFFASTTPEDLVRRGSNTSFPFYWSNYTFEKGTSASGNIPTGQSSNQWVSTFILDNKERDAVNYLVYDNRTPALSPTKGKDSRYIVNGYDFDFGMTKDSKGNYQQTRNGKNERETPNFTYAYERPGYPVRNEKLNLATNKNQVMLDGIKHPYRDAYFTAHMSTSFITGIWYQQNIWEEHNNIIGAYLTAKDDEVSYFPGQAGKYEGHSYVGVQTTQYISYFLDDILALDGRLTKPQKGHGKNTPSNDEIQIINEIMEEILSTPKGRKVVINAVGVAAERNLGKQQHLALELLEKALEGTSFADSLVKDVTYDTKALDTLIYDGNSNVTLKNHLEELISTLNLTTKDEIINAVVNNKEAFIKLLVETYDRAKRASNHATIPISNINDFVYKLITNNPSLSQTEIDSLLSLANDADLNKLVDIYKRKIPINTSFGIFTITSESWTYNEGTFGTSYTKELMALNDNSTISFTTDKENLRIVYSGAISVNGTRYQNTSMQERTFNLSGGANTLTADANTKIYLLEANTDSKLIGTTDYNNLQIKFNGGNSRVKYNLSNSIYTYTLTRNGYSRGGIEIDLTSVNKNFTLFFGTESGSVRVREDGSLLSGANGANGIALTGGKTYVVQADSEGDSIIKNLRVEYSGNANGIDYKITQQLVPPNEATIPGNLHAKSSTYGEIEYESNGTRERINVGGKGTNINGKVSGAVSFYSLPVNELFDFSSVENEIVARIESEYNKLNDLARYVFDSTLTKPKISGFDIIVDKPSYIFIEATGNGEIEIAGVNKAVQKGKTYVYKIDTAGSYTPGGTVGYTNPRLMDKSESLTLTTSGSDNVLSLKAKEIINFDYSALNGFFTNLNIDSVNKHEDFIKIYGVRDDTTKVSLRKADLVELVMTLFPTMKSGENHPTNKNQWILFLPNTDIPTEQRIFKDTDLANLAKMIAQADYETNTGSLAKLFDQYSDLDGLKQILLELTKNERVLKEVLINIEATAAQNNNKSILDLYRAAYLGDDFLNSINTFDLRGSKLYSILNLLPEEYRFINVVQTNPNDESTIVESLDVDKFKNLMKLLGFDLTTEGYGIYALSSSKGILNGSFIPDNIVLSTLDKKYDENLHLTDVVNPSWRGGNATNPNLSVPGSVNEAVLKKMKQLKLSISTTIFNLDLVDKSGTIHHSSESSIDLKNKTITYYLPRGYIESLADKSLTISGSVELANGASYNIKDNLQMALEIPDGIIVTAEDKTVVSSYKIIFKEIDIDFNLDYTDGTTNKNIASAGEKVVLRVQSGTNKLPMGMDLSLFIKVKLNNEIIDNSLVFTLPKSEGSTSTDQAGKPINDSLGNAVVDKNGNALITLNILPELTTGDYEIILDIFSSKGGVAKSVTFTKLASNLNLITSFIYEGKEMINSFQQDGGNLVLDTEIEFGRAFDYEELTNPAASSFYLNKLMYSAGATATITATKALADGIMTYSVSYLITAENGTEKTYIHRLKEKLPFNNKDRYVTVYENGEAEDVLREYDALNPANNIIKKSFERGLEPQFSIKYSLSNFYLVDSNNINYKIEEDVKNNPGSAIIDIYSGMMITVTSSCEPGNYTFNYIYSSKGLWNDGEYVREYTFPSLTITKNYSTDSMLKKISFIDTHEILGSLATIMDPTGVIRPNVGASKEPDEINYNEVTDGNKKIDIDKGNINYRNYTGYKDYYTVGTISNASLEEYNPTFKIEEHAEIYLSTSLEKLKYFGLNQGAKTDKQVLSNHDTTFIYVPFIGNDSNATKRVFLVEIENGEWTNVYDSSFSGTDQEIANKLGNLSGGARSFTYDNITWEVDPIAGKASKDNYSLSTDYIGTPQDGHFWYVSYVVFSEDYINATKEELSVSPNNNLTFYHIALIDQTNTVYFDISLKAPEGFTLDSIYLTLAYNEYSLEGTKVASNQISGYLNSQVDDPNTPMIEFALDTDLQILPRGYYMFYVDLPVGYVAEASIINNRPNQNKNPAEAGAYLPPSSIVTQRIQVEITIKKDLSTIEGDWGISIGDIATKTAVLK